jgi:hypothetical protein
MRPLSHDDCHSWPHAVDGKSPASSKRVSDSTGSPPNTIHVHATRMSATVRELIAAARSGAALSPPLDAASTVVVVVDVAVVVDVTVVDVAVVEAAIGAVCSL